VRVGIIAVHVDVNRRGAHHRGILQPQIGPLIAALLPPDVEVEVVNDTWVDPDWSRDYDLLFISSLHSDFDRARQISHYWRRRGAKTVYGGNFASTYAHICRPFFDSIVVGDAEGSVPQVFDDFQKGRLQPVYLSGAYQPERVPTPRVDLLAGQLLFPVSLEATRGCPFTCDFCALTAVGTRYHTRSPEIVVRDIRAIQEQLRGLAFSQKLRVVTFYDNNLGGNLPYLERLCELLEPLELRWGAAVTFNVVADRNLVAKMARSGCRLLFVGLESFNPETLEDMAKFQNVLGKTREIIDDCLEQGILIESALLINPLTDDAAYVRKIPEYLAANHLYLPNFVSWEAPFPGTPYFARLAKESVNGESSLMPHGLLRDFNGHSLVIRPRKESAADLIAAYKWVKEEVFSPANRWRKMRHDLPVLLANHRWCSSFIDGFHAFESRPAPHPKRTHLPGADLEPPEASQVPFLEDDFRSDEERHAILDPYPVSDERGRALREWLAPVQVFEAKGAISPAAKRLVAVGAGG
jgi:pyruvate-formate lyase-activating enzyme